MYKQVWKNERLDPAAIATFFAHSALCAAPHAIQILDCRYQFWGAKQSTKLGFFPTLFAICRSCQKRQKSEASKNWCRQARKPTIIIMIITRFVVLFRPLYCGWKDGLQLH